MSTELEQLAYIFSIVSVVGMLIFEYKLISVLKISYPVLYKKLGQPGLYESIASYRFLFGFVLFGGYKEHELSAEALQFCVWSRVFIVSVFLSVLVVWSCWSF